MRTFLAPVTIPQPVGNIDMSMRHTWPWHYSAEEKVVQLSGVPSLHSFRKRETQQACQLRERRGFAPKTRPEAVRQRTDTQSGHRGSKEPGGKMWRRSGGEKKLFGYLGSIVVLAICGCMSPLGVPLHHPGIRAVLVEAGDPTTKWSYVEQPDTDATKEVMEKAEPMYLFDVPLPAEVLKDDSTSRSQRASEKGGFEFQVNSLKSATLAEPRKPEFPGDFLKIVTMTHNQLPGRSFLRNAPIDILLIEPEGVSKRLAFNWGLRSHVLAKFIELEAIDFFEKSRLKWRKLKKSGLQGSSGKPEHDNQLHNGTLGKGSALKCPAVQRPAETEMPALPHFIFSDAGDVLPSGLTEEELFQRIAAADAAILLSAESHCWPPQFCVDNKGIARHFPRPDKRTWFANGGLMYGNILGLLYFVLWRRHKKFATTDDQFAMNEFVLSHQGLPSADLLPLLEDMIEREAMEDLLEEYKLLDSDLKDFIVNRFPVRKLAVLDVERQLFLNIVDFSIFPVDPEMPSSSFFENRRLFMREGCVYKDSQPPSNNLIRHCKSYFVLDHPGECSANFSFHKSPNTGLCVIIVEGRGAFGSKQQQGPMKPGFIHGAHGPGRITLPRVIDKLWLECLKE